MCSFDFLRKNKKVVVTVGLLLVCVSTALSACAVGKNAAGQSHESLAEIAGTENPVKNPENDTMMESHAEPQTERSSEQESESVAESQPESTEEPELTEEPEPILTADYDLIYEGINIFDTFHYAAFKYMNTQADLYMRRLQDDTGEYIELSLWSDEKEIWYTVNRDQINSEYTGDYDLFYWEHSERLTLGQRLCYYVIPLDGTVYLMRYRVETTSDAVTMSYKVFGIDPMIPYSYQGYEAPLDVGSITVYLAFDGTVDPAVSFPIKKMTAFADTVKGYMENGYLAASTLRGEFEFDDSADRDNPVSPYLYDIFPWIPELVTQYSIDTENILSTKRMLTTLQKVLPTDDSVTMPDVAADGTYFITGDYYSDSDESYLTVLMREAGCYGGHLQIVNELLMDFTGYYDNGILTATQTDNYPDRHPFEIEIFFQKGKATVTFTAVDEEYFINVGKTLTVDRNEKPEELEVMRHAEPHRVE